MDLPKRPRVANGSMTMGGANSHLPTAAPSGGVMPNQDDILPKEAWTGDTWPDMPAEAAAAGTTADDHRLSNDEEADSPLLGPRRPDLPKRSGEGPKEAAGQREGAPTPSKRIYVNVGNKPTPKPRVSLTTPRRDKVYTSRLNVDLQANGESQDLMNFDSVSRNANGDSHLDGNEGDSE